MLMAGESIWRKWFNPLRSRKTRVALATVLAAYAAEFGLDVSAEVVLTILGVGISLILGIAHEDNGQKRVQPRSNLSR
jgi:urease accessory protein UreF